jgi:hypothetical protein
MALENLLIVVTAIIEQMLSKEGFIGIQRNGKYLGNWRFVDLFLYQLFTFIHSIYARIIYNRMKM